MTPEQCCDFDAFLKAMADETRQAILHLLRESERSATELCAHFDLAQPTISHHMAVLRLAKLVSCRQEGKWVYYALNQDCVAESCREILTRFSAQGRPSTADCGQA